MGKETTKDLNYILSIYNKCKENLSCEDCSLHKTAIKIGINDISICDLLDIVQEVYNNE